MAEGVLDQWRIEYNSGIPVYRQIINQARAAVAAGSFTPGDQLPTIRALSEHLNVNPNTVAKAYRELEWEGVIVSERGSGSFVQAPTARTGQPSKPDAKEKEAKLQTLYNRLLSEAAGSGLSESELLNFIKERKDSPV